MKKINLVLILSILQLAFFAKAQDGLVDSSRYKRGYDRLIEVDGHAGQAVIEKLDALSPIMSQYVVEYVFGDVYCNQGITDAEREIAVVASLTALGNARPQLKVHLHAALNVGCSAKTLVHVINQTAPYAGIPASLNALKVLEEVMEERSIQLELAQQSCQNQEDYYQTGAIKLNALQANQDQILRESLGELSPKMVDYILLTYGQLFDEEALNPQHRQIATVASLTALGTAKPQLKLHLLGALRVGVPPETIEQIMLTMTVYAGFPAALNGLFTFQEVLKENPEFTL